MMRSLFSGVSGLTSHQTKMDVIGNNIANVNTYGFKSSGVSFSDLMYQTTSAGTAGSQTEGGVNSSQIGYGTQVAAITKNMARSSFTQTGATMDVAIGGAGFLQAQDKAGNTYYTRAGKLSYDKVGNIVDSNGKFILGTQNADPTNATGLSETAGASRITINVPSVNTIETADTAVALPTASTLAPPVAGTASFKLALKNGNQKNAITLGITSIASSTDKVTYTETGELTVNISPENLAKIKTVDELQTKVNALISTATEKGELANYTGGKMTISIDTSKITTSPLSTTQTAAIQIDAVNSIVAKGATATTVTTTPQTADNLDSLYISDNGTIIGTHAVHGILTFGRIDVATFSNVNGLEEAGDSYFKATNASGDANVAIPGYEGAGGISSGSLEMSNVNLAQEFSDMIVAQRGFQANSRIITTSDSMLEELVNLKR